MTEANTANIKAKTEKHTGSSFGLPNSEIPKFDLSKMEMPAAFREFADKGVAQARNTYENAKAATEEATDLLKGTYITREGRHGLQPQGHGDRSYQHQQCF